MTKKHIEAGMKFGRWTVLQEIAERRGRKRMMLCVCECGRQSEVYLGHLSSGASGGCLTCGIVTHGKTNQPTWHSWSGMRDRCERQTHTHFHSYGGRGIMFCERWRDFAAFLEDMGERPEGMTLDRIDVNLGYFKENCRWSTYKEQSNNRRDNRLVQFQGSEYTVAELAKHLGLNYQTLRSRIDRGSQLDAPLRSECSNVKG